jgi:hypothetical protein
MRMEFVCISVQRCITHKPPTASFMQLFITRTSRSALNQHLRVPKSHRESVCSSSTALSCSTAAMQSAKPLLLIAATLVFKGVVACKYDKHPAQVLVGNDALTLPLSGTDAEKQCASTAAAYGMLAAYMRAFHPSVERRLWCDEADAVFVE